ncbi:hypothetical protein [uncultured Oscillibacter sp.]|uniref:hypothetical protein n=1 Tax=uncultured Oscillibacter sp. TaxID=876091 RepID=UPI00280BFD63|nr:hypothetical protein [uncultured Oscillibacter sp.]
MSFYVTAYLGGAFFVVRTVGADGVTNVSADPVRSAIFDAALFLIVLALGGLWAFRTMTRAEIAASAGIISAVYLIVVVLQLTLPSFPLSLSVQLAKFFNWTGTVSSWLLRLTDHLAFSTIAACFAPLLFIPFGRKTVQ